MKNRLLDIVVCPLCKRKLSWVEIDLEESHRGEIAAGELKCVEGHFYPVINGIPRLLPPALLRETLERFHPVQYELYKERLEPAVEEESALQKKTLQSFSFQWNIFSQMYGHWEENFKSYFEPLIQPDSFKNKLVLDAGCGFGRHAFYAGTYGAEVVAMDLSEAVEAAYQNTRELDRVHVVQGDMYCPPLKPVFNRIYCVGVIQHLPNPAGGFEQLAHLLGKNGELFVWVYGKRQGLYRLVDFMRRYTTHLSMKSMYALSFYLNILSFLAFSLPFKVLRTVPGGSRLAAILPFTRYADLPLKVGQADWFDRLAVPSTVYFSCRDVEQWYEDAELEQVEIQSRDNIGWRAVGRRLEKEKTR